MKKIFAKLVAGIAAATLMVGAFATSAFAADTVFPSTLEEKDEYGAYIDLAKLTDDVSKIAEVVVVYEATAANGCINISSESTGWAWAPSNLADISTDNGDGTFTATVTGVVLASTDSFVKFGMQDWSGSGNTLTSITLKDASGNALYTYPAEDTAAEDTAAEDTAAEDTTSGDALPFVVVALALSALAAGAVVVTRKVSFER